MDNRQNVHRSLGGEFAGLRSSSSSRVQWRNESKKRANGNNRSFCAGPCLNRLRSGGGEPPRRRPRCILESRRDLESILRGGEKEEEKKKRIDLNATDLFLCSSLLRASLCPRFDLSRGSHWTRILSRPLSVCVRVFGFAVHQESTNPDQSPVLGPSSISPSCKLNFRQCRRRGEYSRMLKKREIWNTGFSRSGKF